MRVVDEFFARCRSEKLIMGVLNVTPDSLFIGSRQTATEDALTYAQRLEAEGAAIIDVGAESTRPGALAISEEEERERLGNLVARLVDQLTVPISIDTYKSGTARLCLKQGAHIVNDIWGLQGDPDMGAVIAAADAGVVIMHNRTKVDDGVGIVEDVQLFFERSLKIAQQQGIRSDRILLDPGIGFGKSNAQAMKLLSQLESLQTFDCPILIGLSRKSIFGLLGLATPDERLAATLGAHLAGLAKGAAVVRVHDVRAHAEALLGFQLATGKLA